MAAETQRLVLTSIEVQQVTFTVKIVPSAIGLTLKSGDLMMKIIGYMRK